MSAPFERVAARSIAGLLRLACSIWSSFVYSYRVVRDSNCSDTIIRCCAALALDVIVRDYIWNVEEIHFSMRWRGNFAGEAAIHVDLKLFYTPAQALSITIG
jgi:hypothetical protein